MVDWQITATTIYCDDVDDEVTVIVQKDGAVRCVGFARYDKPDKDTAGLMKQKSRQLQRQLKCTGPECRRVSPRIPVLNYPVQVAAKIHTCRAASHPRR